METIDTTIQANEQPTHPRHFYVCSYGGSGSTMLCKYLSNFGITHHIHSRIPPQLLTHTLGEHFYYSSPISAEEMPYYTVIYIYRNPVEAIYSCCIDTHTYAGYVGTCREHLQNIECLRNDYRLVDLIQTRKDLYGLAEFDANYTDSRKLANRNYPILSIKYEDIFEHIEELNAAINVPNMPDIYPVRRERPKSKIAYTILCEIYADLIAKMAKRPSMEWILLPKNYM